MRHELWLLERRYVAVVPQSHILKSLEIILERAKRSEVKTLVKCGLCGKEVPEQPKITAEGKCSVCGAKLTVKT